jgi:hypothetical protein
MPNATANDRSSRIRTSRGPEREFGTKSLALQSAQSKRISPATRACCPISDLPASWKQFQKITCHPEVALETEGSLHWQLTLWPKDPRKKKYVSMLILLLDSVLRDR